MLLDQITLKTASFGGFSNEQLFAFCQENKGLKIERTADGEIVIMSPTGGKTSNTNFKLYLQFGFWNEQAKSGVLFDSSGGFLLSNGAMRSPDLAWVAIERWQALSEEEKEKFPPLCPDFVIELRSKTDSLKILQKKMQEWIDNDCRLAWLIDIQEQKVYVYHPGKPIDTIDNFDATLSGEQVLPGFLLDLKLLK